MCAELENCIRHSLYRHCFMAEKFGHDIPGRPRLVFWNQAEHEALHQFW